MKSFRAVLAILALGGLTLGVSAQEKPAPEKAFLQHLVGEWDATIKIMGSESKGSETSRLEGGWLISDFKGELVGMKFVGHDVMGFDTDKKMFTGVWVDNMETSLTRYEGTLDATGKVLTTTGESKGQDGKPHKMKNITKIVDKDNTTFEMYMNDGAQPMMTITYKRKK